MSSDASIRPPSENGERRPLGQVIRHHGLSDALWSDWCRKAETALLSLRKDTPAEIAVALDEVDLADWASAADKLADTCDTLLLLGLGGSCGGARALAPLAKADAPAKVLFPETLDPDSWDNLLQELDPSRTGLLVISKSGSTAETLTQFLALLPWLKTAGADGLQNRIVAISDPGDSALRRLAKTEGIRCLDHPPAIGGRFSVFSLVGLFPALVMGLDPREIRRGAAWTWENAAAVIEGAAFSAALPLEAGASQSVMIAYRDRLDPFSIWWRQLWAESLGKEGQGSTPVQAYGIADQHSQLQLYLSGPSDKLFTLLSYSASGQGLLVPNSASADAGTAFLAGRRSGDLLEAEMRATADTLVKHHRPLRELTLKQMDSYAMGALLMHFLMETHITALLWSVPAGGQPAVEEGKILAKRYLAESGPA